MYITEMHKSRVVFIFTHVHNIYTCVQYLRMCTILSVIACFIFLMTLSNIIFHCKELPSLSLLSANSAGCRHFHVFPYYLVQILLI